MDRALPYPIPGPAGSLIVSPARRAGPHQGQPSTSSPNTGRNSIASDSATISDPIPSHKNASNSASTLFATIAWHTALKHLNLPPYGQTSQPHSLALLRFNALKRRGPPRPADRKGVVLPAMLTSFTPVGRDATVVLRDPTASLRATLHASVLASHPRQILRDGTVIILAGVAALAHDEARPSGLRRDPMSEVHLSLLPPDIRRVIPSTLHANIDTSGLTTSDPELDGLQLHANPIDAYAPRARCPPPLPQRPRRQPPTSASANPPPLPAPHLVQHKQNQQHNSNEINQNNRRPQLRTSTIQNGARPPNGTYTPAKRAYPGTPNTPQRRHPGHGGPVRHPGLYRPRPFVPPRRVNPNSSPQIQQLQHLQHTQQFRREQQWMDQSVQAEGAGDGVNGLSEEQLDSLLGDVDVDALIAQSGKTEAVGSAEDVMRTSQPVPQVLRAARPAESPQVNAKSNQMSGNAGASGPEHESPRSGKNFVSENENDTSETAGLEQPHSNRRREENEASKTTMSGLAAVDDSVIDGLFDGFD